MSLPGLLTPKTAQGFGYDTTAEDVTEGLDLRGRTYAITGCNSGIGFETARVLAMRGARIIGVARTAEKADAALAAIDGDSHLAAVCELSEPDSVRACVRAIRADGATLDGLIANAGVMAVKSLQHSHGYELQFMTNHVGHFIWVMGLIDQLADDGRVVIVASDAHFHAPVAGIDFDNLDGAKRYHPNIAYGRSKLANILFARQLSQRLPSPSQVAIAVHPGMVATNLDRNSGLLVRTTYKLRALGIKNAAEGASTQVYAAVHPAAAALNGKYLSNCKVSWSTPRARDRALSARLWEETERIVDEVGGLA